MELTTGMWVVIALAVFAVLAIMMTLTTLYRKVGPNQALIVYGLGGTSVVTGGGTVVWPSALSGNVPF